MKTSTFRFVKNTRPWGELATRLHTVARIGFVCVMVVSVYTLHKRSLARTLDNMVDGVCHKSEAKMDRLLARLEPAENATNRQVSLVERFENRLASFENTFRWVDFWLVVSAGMLLLESGYLVFILFSMLKS